MPFDLTLIAAAWLAATMILTPLMILAVRFALIPLLQTIARPRGAGTRPSAEGDRLARLEERVGELSRQLEGLARQTSGVRSS